jgi:putative membrane-bound dehydrogenase-like protein
LGAGLGVRIISSYHQLSVVITKITSCYLQAAHFFSPVVENRASILARHMKCLVLFLAALGTVALANAAQFKFAHQTLTVPDGFTVEQVTTSDLIPRPIEACFDEQGRLYVTDSSGSNEKPDVQLEKKPHRVLRLEDTKGNGHFDKAPMFADKLMFPEGCLWHNGSLYVSAVPSIWKLTDTNHDGVVDVREEWHLGKTMTGCANDLHGPYLGLDGWIYWCKGAFAEQTYDDPGHKPISSRAAHVFRKRPEGGLVESVMTGGMDNPVGFVQTPDGERFCAGTFFVHPEAGHRDGIIHAIYGGVYGKPHPEVLDSHKQTGELMPIMTHLGPAAACGLTRYQSSEFGEAYRDNLFVCCFNLRKVARVTMQPDGATYKTQEEDFIVSDNTDFHPTDVLEDADGSLLVVDTGGWYKICCPTSQLWKPDSLGAIYRIRKNGAHKVEDPRGLKMDWAKMDAPQLAKLLEDKRPAVVERAIQQLAKSRHGAVSALTPLLFGSRDENDQLTPAWGSSQAKLNAIWALTRLNHPDARGMVSTALGLTNEAVVHAAIHSAGLWRTAFALRPLEELVKKGNPQIRRAAAEALGRLQNKAAIPALLEGAPINHDRVLEHSITYALIDIDDPAATAIGLNNQNPLAQRCAFIALDQMDNGGLKPEQVSPLLLSTNQYLKETGTWIVSHHPEWGEALAGFLRDALAKESLPEQQADLEKQLAQLASNAKVQELLTETVNTQNKSAQQVAIHAMVQAHLKAAPVAWGAALTKAMASPDATLVRDTVTTARFVTFEHRPAGLDDALLHVARNTALPEPERLNALAAARGQISLDALLFDFLRTQLDPAKPVSDRVAAASVFERAKLTPEQLMTLTQNIKAVGPMEVTHLLSAYEHSADETLGVALVDALKESKGHSSLRADTVKPKLAKFPASVQEKLDVFLKSLNVDAAKQHAHLDDLFAQLKGGNVYRGQAIFNGAKAGCSSCHAIGYVGGHVGPDLTSIGKIRTERDLLEAIVYPSASFVRSFEPYMVSTKDGEDYNGVIKKDAPDEVILATGPQTEQRIPRANIADMRMGSVSIMPQGLDEQLSKQELADLVAFLKSSVGGTH